MVEQRGLADGLTGRGREYQQNIQCAAADWHRDAITGQASAASIEPEWTEWNSCWLAGGTVDPIIQDY